MRQTTKQYQWCSFPGSLETGSVVECSSALISLDKRRNAVAQEMAKDNKLTVNCMWPGKQSSHAVRIRRLLKHKPENDADHQETSAWRETGSATNYQNPTYPSTKAAEGLKPSRQNSSLGHGGNHGVPILRPPTANPDHQWPLKLPSLSGHPAEYKVPPSRNWQARQMEP